MEDTIGREDELPPPADGDASPLLFNRRLAAYEWGGGEITFAPVAGFNKKGFLIRNLAALDQGVISDTNTKDDLICLLAFLHEYRHYQQDFQTGIGHWDHIARTEYTVATLSLAKDLSDDNTASKPHPDWLSEAATSYTGLLQKPEAEEVALIEEVLAKSEPNAGELAPLLTTRRVLEADAVLHVYLLITASRADGATRAALREIDSLFKFHVMPTQYSDTLFLALRTFLTYVQDSDDDTTRLENFLRTTAVLLVMSLAHPDPDTLATLGHDAKDYLPGVRFLRLVRAMIAQMQAVDEEPRSAQEFEASLLSKAGFPYPSFYDCEMGWAQYFAKAQSDPFPGVAAARLHALAQKLPSDATAEATLGRVLANRYIGSVMSFVDSDLPLMMKRTDGLPQDILLTGRALTKPEHNFDRLRHVLYWRLAEFISRRRPTFTCPLVKSPYCNVHTERCRQPYADLAETPVDTACRVRKACFDTSRTTLTL